MNTQAGIRLLAQWALELLQVENAPDPSPDRIAREPESVKTYERQIQAN